MKSDEIKNDHLTVWATKSWECSQASFAWMFNFVILFATKTIRFVEAWFICATFLILVKTVKYLTFFYKFIWKEFALFGFVDCLTEWAQGNKVGPKQDALKASCPIFNSLFHYKFTYSLNFRPNSHEKDLPNQQDELTARHPALPDPGCHSRAIVVSCLNWLDTECFFWSFFLFDGPEYNWQGWVKAPHF